MSVLWTSPLALLGIALIAVPIAIHMLVTHQVRTLAFPSLRFLRETQLAALRRRNIEDVWLLLCRCAIVAAAAVALAGPVLQTPSRSADQAGRVSRAVVRLGNVAPETVTRLLDGAFASTTISRSAVVDAIHDALRWLDAQPRSGRELVFVGELQRGSISDADIALIPADVGIRLEPSGGERPVELTTTMLTRQGGSLVRVERAVTLAADATRVTDGAASVVDPAVISIVAAPRDSALAEAALRAALDAGVPWRDFNRRVVIAWDGADQAALQARDVGTEIVRMPVPDPVATSADAVRTAVMRVSGVPWVEPVAISPEQLTAWSRRPGAPSDSAPVVDEGDRRWLWALALALLALEWWLRRSTDSRAGRSPSAEVRVA